MKVSSPCFLPQLLTSTMMILSTWLAIVLQESEPQRIPCLGFICGGCRTLYV